MEWMPAPDKLIAVLEDDFEETIVAAKYAKLSFYEDGYLVVAEAVRDRYSLVLVSGFGRLMTILLDGRGDQLQMANRMAGVRLSRANVADYVRFFCGHLTAKDGGVFVIVESSAGKTLQNGHKLRSMSVKVRCKQDDGSYRVGAYQLYCGSLFRVSFRVWPDGNIAMLDDIDLGPFIETRH